MNNDIIKQKNLLMQSIMRNPKLSKTFKEAMAAPIGSTKREHAKSILAIMNKVGGLRNDGMGGPEMGNPSPQPTPPTIPNYDNMMIFPAAPKFKIQTPIVQRPDIVRSTNSFDKPDGSGGPYDGKGGFTFPSMEDLKNFRLPGTTHTTTAVPLPSPTPGVNNYTPPPDTSTPKSFSGGTNTSEVALTPGQFNNTPPVPMAPPRTFPTPTPASNVSSALNSNPMKTGPTTPSTSSGGTPRTSSGSSTGGGDIKSAAQRAVNEGTGAGLFAMGVADAKFGGSLDQYMNNLDIKLKNDFNLDPLEKQLSDLKSAKGNLVPTLTQYITGKDQYLKFIDQMLDSTKDDLLKVDMSDPASAERYNNQMNYLSTLKGRQTQRYGNFLNSAIADYNADVESTQSNYDTVYKHYSDAITRQGTMAQNEYNTLYTTMTDLYNNLEQAPIKRANLEALNLQNEANRSTILKNSIDSAANTNPKYWADVKLYSDMITVQNGTTDPTTGSLDLDTVTEKGLAGYYNQNLLQGGDEAAMTEAIRRALAKSLGSSSDPATIAKVKGLISDLANNPDPAGAIFATSINNSIAPTLSKALSSYVLTNMGAAKSAAKDLVSSSGGFFGFGSNKPGIQDKTTWMKNHNSLDKSFLENLYNSINVNVGQGTAYEKNPMDMINRIFSGTNDQENANNLANMLTVSS